MSRNYESAPHATNAAARVLDHNHCIDGIVSNYSRISFSTGPTLLAWMGRRAPEVYQAIIEADRESRARFSGHGSALAQAYNHLLEMRRRAMLTNTALSSRVRNRWGR
jgi:hypothetical protein